MSAAALVGACLLSPSAHAASSAFSGSCSGRDGYARYDPPLVASERDTRFSIDMGPLVCTGELDGRAVGEQPATLVLRGRALLSCFSNRQAGSGTLRFSRGTVTPIDDVAIPVDATLLNAIDVWQIDVRAKESGAATGTVSPDFLGVSGDRGGLEECASEDNGVTARTFWVDWRTTSPLISPQAPAKPLTLRLSARPRQPAASLVRRGLEVVARAGAPVRGTIELALDGRPAGTAAFRVVDASGGHARVRVRLTDDARRAIRARPSGVFTIDAAARHVYGATAQARAYVRIGGRPQRSPREPRPDYGTALVSRLGRAGAPADRRSVFGVAMSADGRYVVFATYASNFPGAGDGALIYRKDLETGDVVLVSRQDGAEGAPLAAEEPSISPDGRYVCWLEDVQGPGPTPLDASLPQSLSYEGGDGVQNVPTGHVFVRDVRAGTTRTPPALVSAGDDDEDAGVTGSSSHCAVSPDGDRVAFSTYQQLEPTDTNAWGDFYVYEFSTGTYTRLTGDAPDGSGGKLSDGGSTPSFSADGATIVFTAQTDRTGSGPEAEALPNSHVFAHDFDTGITELIDLPDGCDPRPEGRWLGINPRRPVVSATGRYVAFSSQSVLDPYADPGADVDAEIYQQVYVRDRRTCETRLVSRASGARGAVGDRPSGLPSISDDGRLVAFVSLADSLDPTRPDTRNRSDVFVRDWRAGRTALVSRASGVFGAVAHGSSTAAAMSGDGRRVAFLSDADNLVGAPTPVRQVYVRGILGSRGLLPADAPGDPFTAIAAYRRGRGSLVLRSSEWVQAKLEVLPIGSGGAIAVRHVVAPRGATAVDLVRRLEPGRYRFRVAARDLAGRRRTFTQTIEVGRDGSGDPLAPTMVPEADSGPPAFAADGTLAYGFTPDPSRATAATSPEGCAIEATTGQGTLEPRPATSPLCHSAPFGVYNQPAAGSVGLARIVFRTAPLAQPLLIGGPARFVAHIADAVGPTASPSSLVYTLTVLGEDGSSIVRRNGTALEAVADGRNEGAAEIVPVLVPAGARLQLTLGYGNSRYASRFLFGGEPFGDAGVEFTTGHFTRG